MCGVLGAFEISFQLPIEAYDHDDSYCDREPDGNRLENMPVSRANGTKLADRARKVPQSGARG